MSHPVILAPEGPVLSARERAFFAEADPWGFILFARNVETPDQVRRLTGDLRAAVGWQAPILIDQEGGRVQRMRGPIWREWLPALDQVDRAGAGAERSLWIRARLIAAELHAVGIDVNCAPLADVARTDTHPILRNRLYGHDPDTVARHARATANGLLAGGVLPVLKHLPGYGLGTVDSHLDLPRVTAPRSELEAVDFAAFRPLGDMPMGMTAHIVLEAIENGPPATLSPGMIGFIRTGLGFDGLLMTDDISMEALPGDIASRTAATFAAGCDLVLHCNGELTEMQAVMAATPAMAAPTRRRAEAALAARRAPDPLDIAALEAEFADLLAGQADGAGSPQSGE